MVRVAKREEAKREREDSSDRLIRPQRRLPPEHAMVVMYNSRSGDTVLYIFLTPWNCLSRITGNLLPPQTALRSPSSIQFLRQRRGQQQL